MESKEGNLGKIVSIFKKLLPVLSFIIPFAILYSLYPNSFESTWKGRTYYFFFLWLILLETILSWEEFKKEKWRAKTIKTVALATFIALPTIYVVVANYYGFNNFIVDLALRYKIGGSEASFANMMPLSVEYLVLTVFFALVILAEYGIGSLPKYAISIFFLGLIGMVYLIDNLYPYGWFTPFQIMVPTTAQLAANVLNFMGFQTKLDNIRNPVYGSLTLLSVYNSEGATLTRFAIGWPCAGADSLLIYSIITLAFLKKKNVSLKAGLAYFLVGAIITYAINVLRVVSIFLIAINGGDWARFHDYYGSLYSITWIISYPLIIVGSQVLWRKLRSGKRLSPVST
ncbi:MAG: exosortase/archaeosortase family protein [Candidatus Bathyarchaeia archaeon]